MFEVGIDTGEMNLIVSEVQATETQIKLAFNRAMRRAMAPAISKGRRILHKAIQAENRDALKPRFWGSVERSSGMVYGRMWIGLNPVSIIHLKGQAEERKFPSGKRSFVRFREKVYVQAFILKKTSLSLPVKREGSTLAPLKWEIPTPTINEINQLVAEIVPGKFLIEFERDLKARVKHNIGRK